jgi:hypothetical protein
VQRQAVGRWDDIRCQDDFAICLDALEPRPPLAAAADLEGVTDAEERITELS